MAKRFWARFEDAGRMRDTGEMAQRTKVATFFGSNVAAIRDPESGDLHVLRNNEQDKPERLASFHGTAWNAEASEPSGDGETELAVYHNSGAPIATAMLGDRRAAKDAAPRSVRVENVVRPVANSISRDMAKLRNTSPVLEMQARHVALRHGGASR